MAALRRIWLLLGICMCVVGGVPVHAAATGGLLAVIEAPAGKDGPATLILRRDAGPEIVRAPLPVPASKLTDDAIAPDGRHLVYLTGTIDYDLGATSPDVALHIWRIADGQAVRTIPLLPPDYPANIAENVRRLRASNPDYDADFVSAESVWAAIAGGIQVYAWSPDGTRLAFGSAQAGPSSDLYVYNTLDDTILRLTDGPEQINQIRWSPDGKLIWHNSIAVGLCQACGGHKYVAAADGAGVTTLHGDEIDRFLGWVGPTTYVETDQSNGPGDFDLRLVDVSTPSVTVLWPGIHQSFVLDLATQRLLLRGIEGTYWYPEPSVFFVDLATGNQRAVADGAADAAIADLWTAYRQGSNYPCDGTFFVRPCAERRFDPVSPNGRLTVAADGGIYHTADGSVYLPADEQLAGGAVYWQLNGAGYFVWKGAALFHREIETGSSQQLHSGVSRALWLAAANGAALPAAGVKASDFRPAVETPALATPVAPVIQPIARGTTLDGSPRAVAADLRVGQAEELARQALASTADYGAWQSGLPLLLAREAVLTTNTPVWDLFDEPFVLPAAEAALRTLVEQAAPWVGSFPRGGRVPEATSFAIDPTGSRFATGHTDGTLRLWDPATGGAERTFPVAQDGLRLLAFSDDGRYVVAADGAGRSHLWDLQNGYQAATHYGRYGYTYALAWRPGTETWLVANGDGPVLARGLTGAPWVVYDQPGEALAFSPDGSRLAIAVRPVIAPPSEPIRTPSTGQENPIVVIDPDTGEELLRLSDEGLTYLLAFSPDGQTLISATAYTLRFWDATTGELRVEQEIGGLPDYWAFPADDELAVLAYRSGLATFDLASGAMTGETWLDRSAFAGLAALPGTGTLFTAGGGRPVQVDAATGRLAYPFDATQAVMTVASPTQPWVATVSQRTVFVRDVTTQATVYELDDLPAYPTGLAFSLDGSRLAATEATGHVTVWEMGRGELVWRSQVIDGDLTAPAYTADGRIVLSAPDAPSLMVVDGETGRVDLKLPLTEQVRLVGVGAAGKIATATYRGDADVYNLENLTGDPIALGHTADQVQALAVNLAGDRLALAWRDGDVALWDIAAGELIETLAMPGGAAAAALAFSADGTLLATGANSTAPVMLWDAATGAPVRTVTPSSPLFGAYALAFSADTTRLIVTDGMGVSHILSLDAWRGPADPAADSVPALLARAAALVPRTPAQFTPRERGLYGIDAFVGAYPLSASGSVNVRQEPFVRSLIVRPGEPERLEALTNEGFLLASADRGETWAILARLPLTMSANSLAIPARPDDPPLVATQQGLFRYDAADGSLRLIHDRPLAAVSYSHTNQDELWAVAGSDVVKSEDGGRSWGLARNDLAVNRLYGPLLMASPNNNPQLVAGSASAMPSILVWRSAGNGFWQPLPGLPVLSPFLAAGPGMAWDVGNRALYLGGNEGQLYVSTNVDEPDTRQVAAALATDFGLVGRPVPLAVGAGPALYLTLWGPYGPRLLRGSWDGQTWSWLELRLPIVAAG